MMLLLPWLRIVTVTLALWCVALVSWLFCLPNQPAKNLADSAEHTIVLSNPASEDLASQVHALAQEEGYSYILTTSSELTLGSIYDPAGRYHLDEQVRDSLDQAIPLQREGLKLFGHSSLGLGTHITTYSLPPAEADAYPQVLLPPAQAKHPIYHRLLISHNQPLDGQILAQQLSPSVIYEGTLVETQTSSAEWLLTGIYAGGTALVLLVYLVVTYRNIQGQVPHLRVMAVLGGSRWDRLKRTLAVSALPSLLVLGACALASYLYQLTPLSGLLRENPRYLQAMTLNLLSLPWLCLALSLGLSYFCIRQVKNENLS